MDSEISKFIFLLYCIYALIFYVIEISSIVFFLAGLVFTFITTKVVYIIQRFLKFQPVQCLLRLLSVNGIWN